MIIFELILKQKCVKRYEQFKYYHEMHLKPDKLNKIGLKWLNSCIFKDEGLNWSKIWKSD